MAKSLWRVPLSLLVNNAMESIPVGNIGSRLGILQEP